MTQVELERELRELREAVEWPAPSPGFDAALAARLADAPGPASGRRRSRPGWMRDRRLLAALLALLVAGAASPARGAVERLLGIAGGERIERVDRVPAATGRLDLGRAVSLTEAQRAVGFAIVLPRRAGAPAGVRVGGDLGPGAVSLRYGVDTILTELAGADAVLAVKRIAGSVTARYVDVGGAAGFWIARGPRVLVLPAAGGGERRLGAALPGSGLLLWDRGGVIFRLETRRPLAQALAIARSAG
jgi:hypothetical protein